jgi:hypothetical protein
MPPSTISGINQLDFPEKFKIYTRLIPPDLLRRFNIPFGFKDELGRELLRLRCPAGSPSLELTVHHQFDFPDPILYGHLTDTLNGQIHILLYILNDPDSPRFNVDRMPDGRPTVFGTRFRNIEAEISSMQAGLAPGQVRRGLRMLSHAISSFEVFIASLGQKYYFAEPLYYHNAILFEHYGFAYQTGKNLMERIQIGFSKDGDITSRLDASSPFKQPDCTSSIRRRSWAIHDGILGEPFDHVTMYKQVGKAAGIQTCVGCSW